MRTSLLFLLLTFFCNSQHLLSQVHIGPGTHVYTTPDTYIILDNIDLTYDSDPVKLDNIFRFTGDKDAKIGGARSPFFNLIEVDKSSKGKLILSQNINVDRKVMFKNGLFELNNFNLLLSPLAIVEGEREESRFTGNNGGFTSISFNIKPPSASDPVTVNPGNLGVIITATRSLGEVTIKRGHQAQYDERAKTSKGILRYYDIKSSNNANLNASLKFLYFDAELNGNNKEKLGLLKSTNSSNTLWEDQGLVSRNSTYTRNAIYSNSNYIQKTGIRSFSRYTLGQSANPVPVQTKIIEADRSSTAGSKIPAASKTFIIGVYPTILTNNNLYIQIGNAGMQKMQASIFNVDGQMVLNRQLSYQSQALKLPNLSAGLYHLVLQSDNLRYKTSFVK